MVTRAQRTSISVENIQKTVADYYKIKVADMYSKKQPELGGQFTTNTLQSLGRFVGGWLDKTVGETSFQHKELHVLGQTPNQWFTPVASAQTARGGHNCLGRGHTISCGARESVAAHGLHRPTRERPGVRSPVTGGWRFTSNPAPRPRPRDRTKRATQNDFCSDWPTTRALDRLNGAAHGARWVCGGVSQAGRECTVGCIRVALWLAEEA